MTKPTNQCGFTIIELLLAMAFFAFILVFMTSGFIFINRQYTKGIIVREVHGGARNFIEELSRNLRLNPLSTATVATCDEATPECALELPAGIERMLCFESGLSYYWEEPDADEASDGIGTQLWRGSGCAAGFAAREPVLSERVAVWDINVTPVSGADNTYRLQVALVASGEKLKVDEDVDLPECAEVAGPSSAYCDVVSLTSVVTSR